MVPLDLQIGKPNSFQIFFKRNLQCSMAMKCSSPYRKHFKWKKKMSLYLPSMLLYNILLCIYFSQMTLAPQIFMGLKISSNFPTGRVGWVCLRAQGPLYILTDEKWLHPQIGKKKGCAVATYFPCLQS